MPLNIKRIPKPQTAEQVSLFEQPEAARERMQRGMKAVASVPAIFKQAKQSTGIEWTNLTWNPMVGCSIHTAGCTNCYAMKQAGKITAPHYDGVVKFVKGESVWTGKVNQSPPHILNKPRTLSAPSLIFVNSMSDFFHADMKYEWQADAMKVMRETPQHVYQILTKRPENIAKYMKLSAASPKAMFPRNVWVGVTMERHDYRHRIDILREVPAYIRFLSVEPLVGPAGEMDLTGIHWVIIGGESGPGARPMKVEWVREVIDQCKAQNVPVFFKQWGVATNNPLFAEHGPKYSKLDPVGKGGSLVDGVAYKHFPTPAVMEA